MPIAPKDAKLRGVQIKKRLTLLIVSETVEMKA
jgi:hypothetical protein